MNLILFLGAGVSVPSGLPTATQLMDRILCDPYHHEGGGVFSAGLHNDPAHDSDDLTRRIRDLIRLLITYDESDIKRVGYYVAGNGFKSSGAIYRGVRTTYEDVYFLCQQMSLWNIGLSDNSMTTPFMECIERMAGDALSGPSTEARIWDLATLSEKACYFIETVIADTLRRDYVTGFDLLLELANSPQIEQLNIVTLNHDTLVEQFLIQNKVMFVDGFGSLDGDVRWSDDRLYDDATAHIRLFKLHGSVDWYKFWDSPNRTASVLKLNAATVTDATGKKLNPQTRRPTFLSGINKVTAYQRGVFADVHYRFHELLRSCSDMVMSGYGWGDTAINFQLDKWLDDGSRNRIILMSESPEKLADRSLILESSWDARIRSGQFICIKKYFGNVSLNEIQAVLNTSALAL